MQSFVCASCFRLQFIWTISRLHVSVWSFSKTFTWNVVKKIHLISFQIVAIWSGFSALRDPSQVLDIDKSKWVTTSFLYIDILLQLSRHSVYWYIWWDDKHKTPLPSYWLHASGLQYPNGIQSLRTNQPLWTVLSSLRHGPAHIEGILPKGPYLPCVSMADRGPFGRIPSICISKLNMNLHHCS